MKFLLIAGLADSLLNFRGPLILALQARGMRVHVAAPDVPVGSFLRSKLEGLGLIVHEVPLRRTGTNPLADLVLVWTLWRLMLRVRPRYVLGYTIKPVIYGSLAAWLGGVPSRFALITGLGYAFQGDGEGRPLQTVAQRLYALALAHVEKVFFQNPDDEKLFRQRRLIPKGTPSCIVNGSGVDLLHFRVAPCSFNHLRFLLIARLLGDKGIREYAAASRQVRARHPEARFMLVGWIDDSPDAIKQSELDAWIRTGTLDFLGRMEDVRPAIADCSVYVLPSYREGTPRTVLEAMAMGRAVITTDAPGCRETVVDGDNGFLVPVSSVEALVTAMERFFVAPELIQRMGSRSREIVEERYDVHKVNAAMLKEMGIL
jgi:glycosyltransferase involved in cell wall biosynthesis